MSSILLTCLSWKMLFIVNHDTVVRRPIYLLNQFIVYFYELFYSAFWFYCNFVELWKYWLLEICNQSKSHRSWKLLFHESNWTNTKELMLKISFSFINIYLLILFFWNRFVHIYWSGRSVSLLWLVSFICFKQGRGFCSLVVAVEDWASPTEWLHYIIDIIPKGSKY